MTNFSGYKIWWAIVLPKAGVVPQKDQKVMNKYRVYRNVRSVMEHFSSKDRAVAFAENLRGKLSKSYDVIFITDKQFGLQPPVAGATLNMTARERIMSVATSKQKSEMIEI